jgi:putative inorganic carbon (HCO3(-)) transporter
MLNARLAAVTLGAGFFAIPLFPSLITLTAASVPGVSLLTHSATLALAAIAAVLAATAVALVLVPPRRAFPTALAFGAIVGAELLAAVFGLDPRAGVLLLAIGAAGIIWHAAVLRWFRSPGVATTIFTAYLASGALASAIAIALDLAHRPAALYTISHGRATGTFVLPGELAGYLIVYVPVALAVARTAPARILRALAWSGAIVASAAFVLTFSRAGYVGMAAAGATYVLLMRRRNGPRYAVAIGGIALVAVALAFNAHHDPSENFTRLSIWQAALGIVERFPFTGVGPLDFARIYPYVRVPGGEPVALHAHSVVLTFAAETGIVGLAALAFGWQRFGVALRRRLRAAPAHDRVALAIAAGLAGTWVQGLIDTVTVVIAALWFPMTALALAAAGDELAAAESPARRSVISIAPAVVALAAILAVCATVQLGSSALLAAAAAPGSFPNRLPPQLGMRIYERIASLAPLPFVEATLAHAALRRHDLAAANAAARTLPSGPMRSDLLAQIASAAGLDDAAQLYLDAGDDDALQRYVGRLQAANRLTDAYVLERRVRDRLLAARTRPNAVADADWRLGRLAVRLNRPNEAAREYARAIALAPLNAKYLIDAGQAALQRRDRSTAAALFARAIAIDPRRAGELNARLRSAQRQASAR